MSEKAREMIEQIQQEEEQRIFDDNNSDGGSDSDI